MKSCLLLCVRTIMVFYDKWGKETFIYSHIVLEAFPRIWKMKPMAEEYVYATH